MANQWNDFNNKVTLLDVTVPQIAADVELRSPSSGSASKGASSTIEVTANKITSMAISNGYVADAYELIVIPPVDADGSTPDVEISFEVDGVDLKDYFSIDASADGNIFPDPHYLTGVNASRVMLGLSTRNLLRGIASGKPVPKMLPTLITGLKATQSINVKVISDAGWGQSGSAITPMRIILKGDLLRSTDIDQYYGILMGNSHIRLSEAPMDPVEIPYLDIKGNGSLFKAWQALPGGPRQGSTKVMRRITYATNQLATGTNGIFYFTQLQALQGTLDNVVDQQHDLGDDYTQNDDLFIWHEFGYRFSQQVDAYVGLRVDGIIVPQDTPQGTPVSQTQNPFHYGSVQPIRSESNLYFSPAKLRELARVYSYHNAVVPFVSTSGTTSIPVGGVKVLKGGVIVTRQ